MKKTLYAALSLAAVIAVSCKKDISSDVEKSAAAPAAVITLTGNIGTTTIAPGDQVFLDGIVYLNPGAVLTIPAGTVVTGKTTACGVAPDLTNLANNKGTLVVRKGAQLIANGTPTNPIVWTSANPVGSKNRGDWGGIVLLGDAPIRTAVNAANPSGCGTTNNFEAFAALTNGFNGYGGSNVSDNSGSITYNRIEYCGGTVTAPNAEVNGLTLCGVGNATVLNHIEVLFSGDDAFEWFGGSVNASHLLSYANQDDDFDFDEGYQGILEFIVADRTTLIADNSGSEMIELDGNATATVCSDRSTFPIIINATLVGPGSCSPIPANCVGTGRFDAGAVVRRQGRILMFNTHLIGQANPVALAVTPSTVNTFAPFFGFPVLSSVAYTTFQWNLGTQPVLNDNDEGGSFAPLLCATGGDATPGPAGDLNNLIGVLLTPADLNSAPFGSLAAFGFGTRYTNTATSNSAGAGVNVGGTVFNNYTIVGTTERGGVRSTDPWTSAPWVVL
jgi:hypothetical protein